MRTPGPRTRRTSSLDLVVLQSGWRYTRALGRNAEGSQGSGSLLFAMAFPLKGNSQSSGAVGASNPSQYSRPEAGGCPQSQTTQSCKRKLYLKHQTKPKNLFRVGYPYVTLGLKFNM